MAFSETTEDSKYNFVSRTDVMFNRLGDEISQSFGFSWIDFTSNEILKLTFELKNNFDGNIHYL